ncbi:MAG TPA: hypothetical protein VNJ08_00825 [Bacteriovoracaceae bacterium]|nr:hypothetical protein [Bacteriovoracaceae bacterium]
MNELQKMYPSLTTFSDLNWDLVGQEYEATSIDISFPEYLQLKAEEGDCPPYLFEIAYYELAAFNARTCTDPFPINSGIYLNPTALFLSLEFDVLKMLEVAQTGKIEIYEKPHVLCLYRDVKDELNSIEIDETGLLLLQQLENGPQIDRSFVAPQFKVSYKDLVEKGLILDLLNT